MGGVAPEGEDAGEGRSARQRLLHWRVSDPTHVHHGGGCSGTTGCILKTAEAHFFSTHVIQQIRQSENRMMDRSSPALIPR